MGKPKLTEKELIEAQRAQIVYLDIASKQSAEYLLRMDDELPAMFIFNEGLNMEKAEVILANDYDVTQVDEKLPFGRMNTNQAFCDFFHLDKEEAAYMGLGFIERFSHPEVYSTLPQQTALYANRDEKPVLNLFMRMRETEKSEYEWTLYTMKYYAPKDTIISLITPLGRIEEIGHKLNRMLDENAFIKANLRKFALLTNREREIIGLLAQGLNNPQIADKLYISRATVEQHRKNINRKLEIQSFAHLLRFALAFDLL